MPRFFLPDINPEFPCIEGEDAQHIARALRMKAGERLIVCDTRGNDYECEITELERDRVRLRCLCSRKNQTEPSARMTLYQCIPKGDKFEDIIRRAVELGVYKVVPVLSLRCVSRPDTQTFKKKRARYQKIAKEAAMQSGRGIVPNIEEYVSLKCVFAKSGAYDKMILFYEGEAKPLSHIIGREERSIALIVGPEGGFSREEAAEAVDSGIQTATLGRRILRCETAPAAALTLLLYLTGNMY